MTTPLLIIIVTINAVFGQLLLKYALSTLERRPAFDALPKFILEAATSPWIYASLAVQGLGYLLWILVISREKIGVASASVGAGFYILMPLCAWALFGESLNNWQWLGISIITVGVVVVGLGAA